MDGVYANQVLGALVSTAWVLHRAVHPTPATVRQAIPTRTAGAAPPLPRLGLKEGTPWYIGS